MLSIWRMTSHRGKAGFLLVLSLLAFSCKQYDYVSPTPGVIEVHLKAKNSRTDVLPFAAGDSNNLSLVLSSLYLVRGDVHLPIYADLHAIRRDPNGDVYNALTTNARDSVLIIGQAYAAPGSYDALELTIDWAPFAVLSTGFYPSQIEIRNPQPPPPTFHRLQQLSIQVAEAKTTRVTLTVDLDASLIRIEEWFELNPTFYVSSVQNF